MRQLILPLLLILYVASAYGQQRPQYSMYMVNPFILNPAVAGAENYIDIRMGYRKQWVNFDASPRTTFLSAHGPVGKAKCLGQRTKRKSSFGYHGIGGSFTHDLTGPSSRIYSNVAYAYHMKFAKNLFVSMGASVGAQSYRLDTQVLDVYVDQRADIEPYLELGKNKASIADISLGTWIYSNSFYFGAALTQLTAPDLEFQENPSLDPGKLNHHYFLTGGYKFMPTRELSILPSIMFKGVTPAPLSVDLNIKARWYEIVWAGLSYRHKDALTGMVGYIYQLPTKNAKFRKHYLDISYAFDLTLSDIRKYNHGTHEIIIGYRMPLPIPLACPSHYW